MGFLLLLMNIMYRLISYYLNYLLYDYSKILKHNYNYIWYITIFKY